MTFWTQSSPHIGERTRRWVSDGYPRAVALFRRVAALLRHVCNALCFARMGVGASRRAALRLVGVSRLCSHKHSRRRRGEYRNINTPESHAELSGVCRFLICGDVWNQYQSIYCCALSCRSIASAACFPSPIARMTVAPPLTMSPPA